MRIKSILLCHKDINKIPIFTLSIKKQCLILPRITSQARPTGQARPT